MTKKQAILNHLKKYRKITPLEALNEYGLDRKNTKLMATARMAMIYSKEADKIKIAGRLQRGGGVPGSRRSSARERPPGRWSSPSGSYPQRQDSS